MRALATAAVSAALLAVPSAAQPAPDMPADAPTDAPADAPSRERDVIRTASAWLTGSFSSGPQAERDPEYFDIRLHVVPIWTERDDGPWLYVEQAVASALDRPYRQRIYHLRPAPERGDGVIASDVYTFDEPLRYAGAWGEPERFDRLGPDDLTERAGCTVYLTMMPPTEITPHVPAFYGATTGKGCSSDLRGAAYATSEVRLFADGMHSWDRGFDADGRQVWGAVKGPYEFTRLED